MTKAHKLHQSLKAQQNKMTRSFSKGQRVYCLTGKDKGKFGSFMSFSDKKKRVLVEGVNLTYHHVKETGEPGQKSGRIKMENPLHYSNILLVCPSCAIPTRPRTQVRLVERNGKMKKEKVRICHRCNTPIATSNK
jgi:large subunit ribosomal protein L24